MQQGKGNIKQRLGLAQAKKNQLKNNASSGIIKSDNDARLKLIQKKRASINDARDRLGQIARQTDARVKLNKKQPKGPQLNGNRGASLVGASNRKFTTGNKVIIRNQNKRPQALLNQTFSNNTVRNIRKKINSVPVRTINNQMAVQRNVGQNVVNRALVSNGRPRMVNNATRTNAVRRPTQTTRPLVESIKHKYYPTGGKVGMAMKQGVSPRMTGRSATSDRSSNKFSNARSAEKPRTYKINRALMNLPSLAASQTSSRPRQTSFKGNVWFPGNSPQEQSRNSSLRVTASNQYMGSPMMGNSEPLLDAPFTSPRNFSSRGGYGDALYSEVLNRLDSSGGMNSHEQSGFKLRVSNLHPIVTHEDVQELFQTIGPLKNSRMLGGGRAEVVFAYQDDASRAIDVYHNRQLDGQAMNVVFVGSDSSSRSGGGNSYMTMDNRFSNASRNSSMFSSMSRGNSYSQMNVSPDMGAFQDAMFNQRSMSNSFNQRSMPMSSNFNQRSMSMSNNFNQRPMSMSNNYSSRVNYSGRRVR